jgi:hypothetical protein
VRLDGYQKTSIVRLAAKATHPVAKILVELVWERCYMRLDIKYSRTRQTPSQGHLMIFRYSIRFLTATMLLGLAMPVAAQTQSVFQPGTGTPQAPVLPTEPPVNAPAEPLVEPPVVEPEPAPQPKTAKKKGPVDVLKPGQFVWEKRDSYEGPLKIVVVLDIQRM